MNEIVRFRKTEKGMQCVFSHEVEFNDESLLKNTPENNKSMFSGAIQNEKINFILNNLIVLSDDEIEAIIKTIEGHGFRFEMSEFLTKMTESIIGYQK